MAKISILDGPYDEGMHEVSFDGQVPRIYSVGEIGSDDYVEGNRQFLYEFLCEQAVFPLYISFIVYDDMYEELAAKFREENIVYTIEFLEAKNYYWTAGDKIGYHPPCFRLIVPDKETLDAILRETYWLPAQNEFYVVSVSDNFRFVTKEVPLSKKKMTKVAVPTFQISEATTFFTIEHDGQGFHLFSNEERYRTVDELQKQLPAGTVVCQVNDIVYEELW